MEKDQKLFDLFRDNEHKLHEYPSADAWRRLEQRLDAHRRRRRIAVYRPIAMAATVILLVGMVALFTWVSHTLNQEKSRTNAHFVLLEDLPPGEGSSFYAQNLALREKYEDADLDEGDSHKRFHVNQAPQSAGTPIQPLLKKSTDIKVDYSAQPKITADDNQWLAGIWASEGTDQQIVEEWTQLNGQVFQLAIYSQENGQKNLLEKTEVRVQSTAPRQVVFFTSGSHPKSVEYELQGDTLVRKEHGAVVRKMKKG